MIYDQILIVPDFTVEILCAFCTLVHVYLCMCAYIFAFFFFLLSQKDEV